MDEDAKLAKDAAAGDSAAFSQLVRRHESAVRRFLTRLSGHSADDLAQEVFVKAWRLGSSWRGTGTYKNWLMGIAWAQFLTARRGDQRRVARESNCVDERAIFDPIVRMDVQKALRELDERERAVAILCFGEGCSHGEAAAILRMPLGTLKSVVTCARNKLARRLELGND